MPYDATIHANPPSFTAKGMWRSARGKADEASAAKKAFLASGGDVEPPADLPMPAPAPAAMPMPPSAPEPVTFEAFWEKLKEVVERNVVDADTMTAWYEETTGGPASDSFQVYQTNESARAAMMEKLNAA